MGIIEKPALAGSEDEDWMRHAIRLAQRAEAEGEVPIGAVLVKDGVCIAEGWNRPIGSCDPTAHAEIEAMRKAGRVLNNYRLVDSTLYVTLEPCVMCMGAIVHARIQRLVYGAFDPVRGAVCSVLQLAEADFLNHRVEWRGGVLSETCGSMLTGFFKSRR
ncbi:MAG: tRNA adenosine(34) deaminase TadA [Gammaproteobacteria bacterium]